MNEFKSVEDELAFTKWELANANTEIRKAKEAIKFVFEIASGSNYASFDNYEGWKAVYNRISELYESYVD